jgi:hypothetical protein
MLGAVFTAFTVSTNASLAVSTPSLTVAVIVAEPVWLAAGLTVTVRLLPLPPNTMFPLGTSVGFDELPLKVRFAATVSGSPTVKPIAAVGVFTVVN